jgi:CubicO group peptidase (beta-lactamase class C family)
VRHVLSHTAGYLDSGSAAKEGAADHFGVSLDEVTAAQYHQAVLLGTAGAPFLADPGTAEKYSNHGFSVAGLLIEEASDEGSYRDYVEQHLLDPLGLPDVVPNNAELGVLDTVPHSSAGEPLDVDPTTISRLGLSTGGWTASARDLARIMCSIDQTADNQRSLEPATVVEMAADAVASAPGVNPLGWDSSNGTEMTKNGAIPGGTSRISKFLAGAFDGTDDEINVAVAVNQSGATPPASLLRNIAQVAADASVPATYDLFEAVHRCRTQPGLTIGERVPPAKPAPTGLTNGPRVEPDGHNAHKPVEQSGVPSNS